MVLDDTPSACRGEFHSELGPDLMLADNRFINEKKGSEIFGKARALNFWIDFSFDFDKIVYQINETDLEKKFLQLIKFIKNRNVYPKNSPHRDVLRFASEVVLWHERMEDYMVLQANKYSADYDQVFILVGAAHAASMHVKTNFPYSILFEPKNQKEELQICSDLLKHLAIPKMLLNL